MDNIWISDGKEWRQNEKPGYLRPRKGEKYVCDAQFHSLSGRRYNLSFANQQFSRAYGDAAVFGVRYFGMDELITGSNISLVDYITARNWKRQL